MISCETEDGAQYKHFHPKCRLLENIIYNKDRRGTFVIGLQYQANFHRIRHLSLTDTKSDTYTQSAKYTFEVYF